MVSNLKIVEKLRDELTHLNSQKVDILDFEMSHSKMLQRISELEDEFQQLSVPQSVENSLEEANENVRKLRDFMLSMNE